MVIQLNGANIVILAQNHNPTIASNHWLFSKGIIPEEATNFMHTPILSHYESPNFMLDVGRERWQVRANNVYPAILERLQSIALAYVKALSETVYRAIGINLEWLVKSEEEANLVEEVKRVFINPSGKLANLSNQDDCVVVGIIYLNHDGFRVQVTVEPNTENKRELRFRFNYHQDITAIDSKDRLSQIEQAINKFSSILQYSEKLVKEIIEE